MIGLIHCPAAFVIGSSNYTGGLFPLVTSGSRYRTLNVRSDASSIETKKTMIVLVCLSIDELLSSQRYLYKTEKETPSEPICTAADMLKAICTRRIEFNVRTDIY